ncbi:MAG: ABC transporter permease [Candidatus Thorarchaeota archaeon]|nr:ABC transporter permease [Candidatus Thorarchaeota archaeon]
MSEQDYASKDLKRRPFRTTLILLSMVSIVAATTFLFLFGNVLLDVTSFVTSTGTTSSLGVFLETFIWATLILVLILGAVVVSSTISLEMVARRKDIGLMKAVGTLMDTLFDHFMAQAVMLLGASVIIGIAVGTVIYLVGLVWLASAVPTIAFSFNFPILQVVFLAAIFLLSGFFAAQKPIYDTVHESPIDALNPEVGSRVQRVGFLDSFGLVFRTAAKASGRRVKGSRRTLLSLFLSVSLASMLWIGGGVVEATTNAYIIRSMGSDVVAVGDPALLDQYYSAYSLSGSKLDSTFDFANEPYRIPSPLVTELEDWSNVRTLESRILAHTTVTEGAGIIWNPTIGDWEMIGEERSGSALVVGIDWQNTISDWYYEGSPANLSYHAWLGGELASTLYTDPLIQSIGIEGAAFDITAIAFDIVNGGDVAFISYARMQDLFPISGPNLLLLQLYDYDQSSMNSLEAMVSDYGMEIFSQQAVVEENLRVVGSFWSLLQPLPLIALFSAFLSLMNYLLVSVFGRFRDYVIMRSIGAKPSFIAKTMIAEGVSIGLQAGFPGVLFATIFSIFFLVPEAAVPSLLYLPFTMMVTIIALLFVVMLAAIPVYVIFSSRTDLRVSEFSV